MSSIFRQVGLTRILHSAYIFRDFVQQQIIPYVYNLIERGILDSTM